MIQLSQLLTYRDEGVLLLPGLFSDEELTAMQQQLSVVSRDRHATRILEDDGSSVRSIYAAHQSNEVFNLLSRHPRLVEPARSILGGDVYVYQFKINLKGAFSGDVWQWHQDYIYWLKEDGMPTARVCTAAVFLDEVNEFNGPMFVIPGSHREGVIDLSPKEPRKRSPDEPGWMANLVADIKYSVDRETIARLVRQQGLSSLKGPPGTVVFFDGNLVHGSAQNISPLGRTMIFVTYNRVDNVPVPRGEPRPSFLVSRDTLPITTVADDALRRACG
ncbi:phytanoyl-CoA dioxygenase family protein [Sorangium sp. So ce124]|uniref:phytanoyl-CoA dioxygenase family protein n=1 Tax=Sorangium sp. So ce124 TaxID=3133280 RepID=UPI003F5EC3C7